MLKGIAHILPPDLIKAMMEMGHGDTLVIADANFPAATCATRQLVRMNGSTIPEILEAVLRYLPLDTFTDTPVSVMALFEGEARPALWDQCLQITRRTEPWVEDLGYIERFDYYEQAKKAYVVVISGDATGKGNLLLQKGVLAPDQLV